MSVLQNLKDLKRVLDRNLSTKSQDILPIINNCIIELEKEPKTTKPKQEEVKEQIESKTIQEIANKRIEQGIQEKTKEELVKEYKEKFNKNPFGGWSKEILESKLS